MAALSSRRFGASGRRLAPAPSIDAWQPHVHPSRERDPYSGPLLVSRRTQNAFKRLTFSAALGTTLALAATLCVSAAIASGGRGGIAGRCGEAVEAPHQISLHGLRSSVLCLVNRVRDHYKLSPLDFNHDLRASATHHSKDMVIHGYFAHDGSSGSTAAQRVVRSGYLLRTKGYYIGENIGGGAGRRYGSPLAVVRAWMHSPPHRENILNPLFHDAGVGVARGFPGGAGSRAATYTLDFGARRH